MAAPPENAPAPESPAAESPAAERSTPESPTPESLAPERSTFESPPLALGPRIVTLSSLQGLLAIVMLTALPPLLIYPFPTQDGHQHAFAAFVFGRLGSPEYGFSRYFEASLPLSSQGYVMLLVSLDSFLPFHWAERIGLATTLAAYPLAGALYAHWTRRPLLPVAGMLALVAYGWLLAMGFLNFLVAFAVVPIALGLVERVGDRRAHPTLYLALLPTFLALAWLHVAVAALTGFIAVVLSLSAPSGRRLKAVGTVVMSGLPAAAYAWWVASSYVEAPERLGLFENGAAVYEPFRQRVWGLFFHGVGGFSAVAGLVLTLGVVIAVVDVAARLRGGGHRQRTRGLMALAGLALLLLYLAVPIQAARWAYLSPRILFAAVVALSLVSFGSADARRQQMLVVTATALGLAAAWSVADRMHEQLRTAEQAMAELPHKPGKPLLSVVIDPTWPSPRPDTTLPTLHLGLRALIDSGGGIPAYAFAVDPTIHAILYRDSPDRVVGDAPPQYIHRAFACAAEVPALPPSPFQPAPPHQLAQARQARACYAEQTRLSDLIALRGLAWEEVLAIFPTTLFSERMRHRGYQLAYENKAVELWLARPATLRVALRAPRERTPAPLVIRVGMGPDLGWIAGTRLPEGVDLSQIQDAVIRDLPAGRLDLEIFLDTDDDGEPDPNGWTWRPDRLELRPGMVNRLSLAVDSWSSAGSAHLLPSTTR